VLTYAGHSGAGAATVLSFAWPALYLYAMDAGELASTFVALTDPQAALATTLTRGGNAPGSTSALLAEILAAVKKTY
jgi:hypothetical protein